MLALAITYNSSNFPPLVVLSSARTALMLVSSSGGIRVKNISPLEVIDDDRGQGALFLADSWITSIRFYFDTCSVFILC